MCYLLRFVVPRPKNSKGLCILNKLEYIRDYVYLLLYRRELFYRTESNNILISPIRIERIPTRSLALSSVSNIYPIAFPLACPLLYDSAWELAIASYG
jgi:hypothetical protein